MAKTLMYVEGFDGQVEIMADRIIIHRKGVFNIMKYGFNARREIPLSSISGVEFRQASPVHLGTIDFDHAGHNTRIEAKQNTVRFRRRQQNDFLKVKEVVFELMQAQSRRG